VTGKPAPASRSGLRRPKGLEKFGTVGSHVLGLSISCPAPFYIFQRRFRRMSVAVNWRNAHRLSEPSLLRYLGRPYITGRGLPIPSYASPVPDVLENFRHQVWSRSLLGSENHCDCGRNEGDILSTGALRIPIMSVAGPLASDRFHESSNKPYHRPYGRRPFNTLWSLKDLATNKLSCLSAFPNVEVIKPHGQPRFLLSDPEEHGSCVEHWGGHSPHGLLRNLRVLQRPAQSHRAIARR
jgi:hypothetical protein